MNTLIIRQHTQGLSIKTQVFVRGVVLNYHSQTAPAPNKPLLTFDIVDNDRYSISVHSYVDLLPSIVGSIIQGITTHIYLHILQTSMFIYEYVTGSFQVYVSKIGYSTSLTLSELSSVWSISKCPTDPLSSIDAQQIVSAVSDFKSMIPCCLQNLYHMWNESQLSVLATPTIWVSMLMHVKTFDGDLLTQACNFLLPNGSMCRFVNILINVTSILTYNYKRNMHVP